MGWNDMMFGGTFADPCRVHHVHDCDIDDLHFRRKCDGRDLLRGIKKNDFIKVFLKSSRPVKGFFAGVSGNVLVLFDCEDLSHRVSTTDICLDDIVAIKSFGFKMDDHD